jgi:F-type H+-transporting ATPase subunit gamma
LAKEYAIKSDFNLVSAFEEVGEKISYQTTQPISHVLIKEFLAGKYSKVYIAYMDFISTIKQVPRVSLLLPILPAEKNDETHNEAYKEYTFEPSARSILDSLLPYFIEMKVYQSMLEARASEHSARMVAMKNASDNAKELKGSLNLVYNRTRQANITNELADIVTATASLG